MIVPCQIVVSMIMSKSISSSRFIQIHIELMSP